MNYQTKVSKKTLLMPVGFVIVPHLIMLLFMLVNLESDATVAAISLTLIYPIPEIICGIVALFVAKKNVIELTRYFKLLILFFFASPAIIVLSLIFTGYFSIIIALALSALTNMLLYKFIESIDVFKEMTVLALINPTNYFTIFILALFFMTSIAPIDLTGWSPL